MSEGISRRFFRRVALAGRFYCVATTIDRRGNASLLSDIPTPEETEGSHFNSRSPQRCSSLEPSIEGCHLVLSDLVMTEAAFRCGERCSISVRPVRPANATTPASSAKPSVHRLSGSLSARDDRSKSLSRACAPYTCQGAGAQNADTDIAASFFWRDAQSKYWLFRRDAGSGKRRKAIRVWCDFIVAGPADS